MKDNRKVYDWLALLSFALLALSTFAGPRVVVSQMPEPVRALAEVETNVVFATGAATDNKWTLTIERDAATSNSVEVVFGCDANEDGVLGIEEGELSIGWDCGEWFWRDRRANAACHVEGVAQCLEMTLYLNRDRAARSLVSSCGKVAGVLGISASRFAHMFQSRLESCPRCLSRRGDRSCREQDFD